MRGWLVGWLVACGRAGFGWWRAHRFVGVGWCLGSLRIRNLGGGGVFGCVPWLSGFWLVGDVEAPAFAQELFCF